MTDKQIRDRIMGALSASMMSMEMEAECVRFLDRCLEAPKWILMTERLPEPDKQVLAIVSGRWGNITFDHAYELASWCADEGQWIMEAWPDWEDPEVFHWMPLPEPPKEEV